MCFNQKTSLAAFSVSFVCFVYLLYYGITRKNNYDIFAAIFTLLIGLIQMVEYLLWGKQDCSKLNHYYSLLIIVVLYLQGVVGSITYMILLSNKSERWLSKRILLAIGIYTIFVIGILSWLNQKHLCSKPAKENCRLVWAPFQTMYNDYYGRFLIVIFLCFYFLFGYYYTGGIQGKTFEGCVKYPIRCSVFPFTFILAFLYTIITNGKYFTDTFGSSWCFMSIAFGVISCLHI